MLFLQYGDETRRVHITHELTSLDTLHALIVHMFPQKLTAGMLKSPNTAILIKDEARNVFYELEDVRDIQDRSIIKIYRKEPIYASYPAAAHLANGDLRVSRMELGGEKASLFSAISQNKILVWSLASLTTELSMKTIIGCLFGKVIVPCFIIFIILVLILTITGYYSIFRLVI